MLRIRYIFNAKATEWWLVARDGVMYVRDSFRHLRKQLFGKRGES